jgi:hypothetical protein
LTQDGACDEEESGGKMCAHRNEACGRKKRKGIRMTEGLIAQGGGGGEEKEGEGG